MVDLITKTYSKDNVLIQSGLNAIAVTAGLLVLKKGFGIKFEVGNLPPKSLFIYPGVIGVANAAGQEISNYIGSALGVSDQNKERLNLVAVAVFTIGAIVLSQNGRIRSLPYVGRVVSCVPQLASHNQMLAVAAASVAPMVGMRCIFGNTKRSPNSAPEEVPMSRSASETIESEGKHSKATQVSIEATESEGKHSKATQVSIEATESEGKHSKATQVSIEATESPKVSIKKAHTFQGGEITPMVGGVHRKPTTVRGVNDVSLYISK